MTQAPKIPRPRRRRLKVFAFDPSLASQLATTAVNEVVIEVPWESPVADDGGEPGAVRPIDRCRPGPVGEYLEIIDFDPASDCFYAPVDLNDPRILAAGGLSPSETNPQFHQQMVYAVARNTIRHFEEALGRRVSWAPHRLRDEDGHIREMFVRRLRIYPHALREANAYYSPQLKALLFGYFSAAGAESREVPRVGMVFSCLSYGIIAHETAHALLDGMRPCFTRATNVDMLAFHEAFADLVALFQHFAFPEVLRHQIAHTRGNLMQRSLLGALAQQFGQALGRRGALRDALGTVDEETGEWTPRRPDPAAVERATRPHDRGAILVAAVFDAFLKIYESQVQDLRRIATGGSGVLPAGAIHPDLVNRMAREAAQCARQLLRICIRALDYCPPVDLTFGDYLRAIITAHLELVPKDEGHYRVALIESFRRYGIYPRDVRSLMEDGLRWWEPRTSLRLSPLPKGGLETGPFEDRKDEAAAMRRNAEKIQRFLEGLRGKKRKTWARELYVLLGPCELRSVHREANGHAEVTVQSARLAERQAADGSVRRDLVIEITQRLRGYFDPKQQLEVDRGDPPAAGCDPPAADGDFTHPGGCTLIVDAKSATVRYAISKSLLSRRRLERTRRFFAAQGHRQERGLRATYFGAASSEAEPFAVLHRAVEKEPL